MEVMVRDGLFTDGTPALLGSRCTNCGNVHFPGVDTCPYCSAEDPEPVELSTPGTLWAWTAVTAPPPGYLGEVPFGIGVVELPEGVRVITRLTESDPAALADGPAHGAAHRAPAHRRRRQRRRDVRLRPAREHEPVTAPSSSPASACTPSGGSTASRPPTWASTAVRAALREAGIGKGGFQAAFCGTAYGGVATGHKVLSRLGMTGMPIVDVEAGCASGGAALMLAAGAIRAGQYDTVLVFGTEKMPKGIIRSSFFEPGRRRRAWPPRRPSSACGRSASAITSGVTKDHLARVVVKNRRHGAANPDAMYQKEISVEEVLASRVVCEPLHLFMLCSPNEGAAAVVLTPRRPDRHAPRPVTLAAAVLRSHIPGAVLSESTPLSGLAADDVPAPTTLAARAAYEEAGLGPQDLDVVECQDTDAARELRLVRGARAVRARAARPRCSTRAPPTLGGRLPVNPSGGLLSKGEPLGASALGPGGRAGAPAARRVRPAPGGRRPHRPLAHGRPGRQRRRRHPHPLTPSCRSARQHRARLTRTPSCSEVMTASGSCGGLPVRE